MSWVPWSVLEKGGPWALLLGLCLAFLFARSRGILLTKDDVERIERRMEKDTDRVIALYAEQAKTSAAIAVAKDATIARQAEQIERLLSHSAITSHAMSEIMQEAKRRGHLAQ